MGTCSVRVPDYIAIGISGRHSRVGRGGLDTGRQVVGAASYLLGNTGFLLRQNGVEFFSAHSASSS